MTGMCRVLIYDGSMGYESRGILIDWVDRSTARSICKHHNKQIRNAEREAGCEIDIYFYWEDRNDLEPDLSYWH